MKTFSTPGEVPYNFEGHCYIENNAVYAYYKPGLILHREDGPAVYAKIVGCNKLSESWMFEGENHRLDGPAITYENEHGKIIEEYWVENFEYPKQEFLKHPLVVGHPKNVLNKLNEILVLTEP